MRQGLKPSCYGLERTEQVAEAWEENKRKSVPTDPSVTFMTVNVGLTIYQQPCNMMPINLEGVQYVNASHAQQPLTAAQQARLAKLRQQQQQQHQQTSDVNSSATSPSLANTLPAARSNPHSNHNQSQKLSPPLLEPRQPPVELSVRLQEAARFSAAALKNQVDMTEKIWSAALTDFWPRWQERARMHLEVMQLLPRFVYRSVRDSSAEGKKPPSGSDSDKKH